MQASESEPNPPRGARIRVFLEHYGSTVVGQGVVLGLGVLTGILSARMLGPVGRGEYAAVCIWPLGIMTLLSLGISQAAAFHLGRRSFTISEMTTAVSTVGATQSALTIVIGLIVVPHALAKYSSQVQHLGILFLLLMPALILGVYTSNLFQGVQDLLRFNIIRIVAPFVYLVGLVGLYLTRHGNLSDVILSQLVGYVVALLIGFGMVWKELGPRWHWNGLAVPSLVNFGFRTQATNLANYFNQRIDQLFLSLVVPPRQLGFYAVAVTLSMTVTVFSVAAGIVTFSRGASQKTTDAKITIGHSFRVSLVWLVVSCSVLYAITPMLIRHVFGPAFEGSIVACRILLPGAVMIGMNQILYNGSSALGRPGLPSVAEGVSMAVTAVGLYLLVPRYGYIGAAIVSSISYTLSFLVMTVLAHKLLDLPLRTLLLGGMHSFQNESLIQGE
jgi:O-antigen/teichoic acid export membrane protein